MEHPGESAEGQTEQKEHYGWGALDESHPIAEPESSRLRAPEGSRERRRAEGTETARPPLAHAAQEGRAGQGSADRLLSAVVTAVSALARAEHSALLPLTLRELLAISGGSAGLVVTFPEGPESGRIAIRQNVTEDVVALFIEQPLLLETLPGTVVTIVPEPAAKAASGMPVDARSAQRLAHAGIQWYLALPLTVQGKIEAVIVALGQPPPPAARLALASAATLLGELASAALEQAHLRHLLAHEARARDDFIGLASHELKSPLAIIKGYAQLLLRQARRSEGAKVDLGGLEAISQQVNRMSNLVGELLDVSRVERGVLEVQPTLLELVGLVRRVVEQRQRSLEEGMLHVVAREPAVQVLADPARMEQVLGYLLDNAIKFGQERGQVEVTVERVPASRVPADTPSRAPEEGRVSEDTVALLSIRDYGLGVPVEERSRLFSAFYRGPENSLHRQLAGLGLGLYLSHYLILRQQGHLWAEFPDLERSSGSLFHVSLPLAPAS